MKKIVLLLLTFVPFIIGRVNNISLVLLPPGIGGFVWLMLPLLTTIFWFFLGREYGRSAWKTIPALLIGNATGIISLVIYVWQYLLTNDEMVNISLLTTAHMFSNAAPLYLFARIGMLFETQPNYVGTATVAAMNIIAFIYWIVIFSCGFIWGRKGKNKAAAQDN